MSETKIPPTWPVPFHEAEHGEDYAMTPAAAQFLKSVALVPVDVRLKLLARYQREHGAQRLRLLFAEFIGLANSVVANNREAIETVLLEFDIGHPDRPQPINLPTIFGALVGVENAALVDSDAVCAGCAFRLGTWANQCPITASDAHDAASGEFVFNCHEDLDESEEPTHRCRAYALIRAREGRHDAE